METKTYRGEYVAPEINVVEIKSQGILCASGDQQDYDSGIWDWDE